MRCNERALDSLKKQEISMEEYEEKRNGIEDNNVDKCRKESAYTILQAHNHQN